jgi:hypothetical protein
LPLPSGPSKVMNMGGGEGGRVDRETSKQVDK